MTSDEELSKVLLRTSRDPAFLQSPHHCVQAVSVLISRAKKANIELVPMATALIVVEWQGSDTVIVSYGKRAFAWRKEHGLVAGESYEPSSWGFDEGHVVAVEVASQKVLDPTLGQVRFENPGMPLFPFNEFMFTMGPKNRAPKKGPKFPGSHQVFFFSADGQASDLASGRYMVAYLPYALGHVPSVYESCSIPEELCWD